MSTAGAVNEETGEIAQSIHSAHIFLEGLAGIRLGGKIRPGHPHVAKLMSELFFTFSPQGARF